MRSSTSIERLAVPVVVLALVTGCTIGDDGAAAPSPGGPSSAAAVSASASAPAHRPPRSTAAPRPVAWRDALTRAVRQVDGDASLAVAGAGAPVVFGAGDTTAWSTSKVPVTMAALTRSPQVTANIRAAIVESDNAAAEAVWASLGTPAQAGAAAQEVLRAGGDPHTVVQTTQVRPPFTPFGQTRWADGDAATFAAHIPCSTAGSTVLGLMRSVAGNQQWGAYGLAGARSVGVKGGWGPGTDGGYVVRQLAVIETGRGYVGVMLTVRPADGTFASGTAALTRLAAALSRNLDSLPAARC